MIIKKGKKMAELIEKFRNTRFPNWMRQVKAEEQMHKVEAANDNIVNSEMADVRNKINLSGELHRAYIESLLHDRCGNFYLRASHKRRLLRYYKKCQNFHEWLDEAEKNVKQVLFKGNADER